MSITRNSQFAKATWTISVCPVCAVQSPKHGEPCISNDPPSLRPDHVPYRVVSEKWRELAELNRRA